MKKDTVVSIDEPETTRDALTEVLREGATKLIAEAEGYKDVPNTTNGVAKIYYKTRQLR